MPDTPIRIGFIGVNPDSHWAATAHLPAIKSLGDRFEIIGVANSSPESSRRTAEALGLSHAYANPTELVNSPEIDLVVVTVKVPHHFKLVSQALEAGKHVYCEWPLGNGLEEARYLAELAEKKGVVAVAGTQARAAVEVEYLAQLISDGYVGEVLSTSLIGSGGNWANETSADLAYLFDAKNGASMQAIPLAHTLAAVKDALGPFANLSAQFVSRYKHVKVTETGESLPKSTPDQIMVHGTMASGAALSVHYRGGQSRGTNLLWEINGTEGDLQITGDSGHAQMTQLHIMGAQGGDSELKPLMPHKDAYNGWPENAMVRNVARMYARMADDIENGTRLAPSFADAVSLHALIDSIEHSAAHGQ